MPVGIVCGYVAKPELTGGLLKYGCCTIGIVAIALPEYRGCCAICPCGMPALRDVGVSQRSRQLLNRERSVQVRQPELLARMAMPRILHHNRLMILTPFANVSVRQIQNFNQF